MFKKAVAICQEYLPEFAIVTDQTVDTSLAPLISTIVGYDKLSELSMRLFELGYAIDETDGNAFKVVEDKDGKLTKTDPALVLIFKPMPPAKIDVVCSEKI